MEFLAILIPKGLDDAFIANQQLHGHGETVKVHRQGIFEDGFKICGVPGGFGQETLHGVLITFHRKGGHAGSDHNHQHQNLKQCLDDFHGVQSLQGVGAHGCHSRNSPGSVRKIRHSGQGNDLQASPSRNHDSAVAIQNLGNRLSFEKNLRVKTLGG